MARYFDADDEDSLAMLPADVRRDSELAYLATVVEADVIGAYVVSRVAPGYRPDLSTTSGFVSDWGLTTFPVGGVFLRGYAEDAAAADAGLRRALRREIAEVIRWRWAQHRKLPGATSITKGDPATSESYDANADRPFPPNFGTFLRPYDVRPVHWSG